MIEAPPCDPAAYPIRLPVQSGNRNPMVTGYCVFTVVASEFASIIRVTSKVTPRDTMIAGCLIRSLTP